MVCSSRSVLLILTVESLAFPVKEYMKELERKRRKRRPGSGVAVGLTMGWKRFPFNLHIQIMGLKTEIQYKLMTAVRNIATETSPEFLPNKRVSVIYLHQDISKICGASQ
jgi:hypothetical protein